MAIFGKFGGSANDGPSPADYSPEKAQKFFDHARTALETENFEYAIQNYSNGLKQDPTQKAGLDGLWTAANKLRATAAGKKGPSKETWRAISGSGDVAKFVYALVEWLFNQEDVAMAIRAAELGGKVKAGEVGKVLADLAIQRVMQSGKAKKDQYLKLSEAYRMLEQHGMSLKSAEMALSLDPTDGELSQRIRTLAASAAMQGGGYDQAGTEGGFRKMIKDVDKQKQLTEADSIVKTEETLDRVVAQCEADYKSRPTDQYAIEKYATRLIERGKDSDERRAIEVLSRGYADTQQVRFKIRVGELELRRLKRKLDGLEGDLKKHPDDTLLQSVYDSEKQSYVERSVAELRTRIEAYPTDNQHKYELAKLFFFNDRPQDAIGLLQEIQTDPKIKPTVLNMLGLAFLKIEFLPESVATFRQAAELREVSGEFAMEIQYNLMLALRKAAEADGDLPSAEEANKIAASIVTKNVKFKEIITQRAEINKLVQQLKSK